ncbi:MAG: GNAT family N-acetyltransferase [Rhodobacteraceae bacterium]|nr:GNAT family N-acetyltransferase [Paracoccaceae bacterium]
MSVAIPTIETEHLVLRPPRMEDFEAYAAFRASPRAAFVGGPNPRPTAFNQFCALLGHWHLRGFGRWMVADRVTDAPLGVVGPYYPADWPEPELAWTVFAAAEGRGVAYEATLAARAFAYRSLGWTTAISVVDPANARSAALARRLGAQPDGVHQHETFGTLQIWRHPAPEALA